MLTMSSRATSMPPHRVAALVVAVGLTFAVGLPTAGRAAGGASTGQGVISPRPTANEFRRARFSRPLVINKISDAYRRTLSAVPRSTVGPSYHQVKTWVEAYKLAHPGNGGKDWDINAKTPAQLASDRAAARLMSICGAHQRPVIPMLAWEYGGVDHQWINPSASALVYCVYTPTRNATSHWGYDAAATRVTADVYVKYPDQNPCRTMTGRDQVAGCMGNVTNFEILVDTASLHDGADSGFALASASTELRLIMPHGSKVQLVLNT
jgi:hypothetical protein